MTTQQAILEPKLWNNDRMDYQPGGHLGMYSYYLGWGVFMAILKIITPESLTGTSWLLISGPAWGYPIVHVLFSYVAPFLKRKLKKD